MITGVVEAINLNDESDAINSIWVSIQKGGRNLVKCTPLNMHVRTIPVLGEIVYLVKGPANTSSGVINGEVYYYLSPVGIHRNINHNLMQPYNELTAGTAGLSFQSVSAGVSNSSTSNDSKINFGTGFIEDSTISQIQPFLGDTIFEGRYGQSIRFGYTPQGVTSSNNKISSVRNQPSWNSTKPESPITIIRNGAGVSRGYNQFTIEDINRDDSSLYLTSQQKLQIKTRPFAVGVVPSSTYQKPQAVLTSDRVLINSKKESVLISGETGVYVSTPGWKADMDKMFTQLANLEAQVTALNNALLAHAAALTALPLTAALGAPLTAQLSPITSQLVSIKTELQLMKN
jgi:hypothetical protein